MDLRCWLEVLNSGSHGFHEVLGATKAWLTLWGYLSFSLITQIMFKRIAYKFSLMLELPGTWEPLDNQTPSRVSEVE